MEDGMTKDEMQRYLDQEARRGSGELEAYRGLMDIIAVRWYGEKSKQE